MELMSKINNLNRLYETSYFLETMSIQWVFKLFNLGRGKESINLN